MSRTGDGRSDDHLASPAFSLAETVVSTLLVGGLLVVALNTVGGATFARSKMGDRGAGQLLAQSLMTEILQQEYEDPDGSPVFGPEADENGGARALYDDVDDYDGWTATPPQQRDGTAIPKCTDWTRQVAVSWVREDDIKVLSGVETGIKQITVTVMHNDVPTASLVAIRTNAPR